MLNLSKTDITARLKKDELESFKTIHEYKRGRKVLRISYFVLISFIIISFADWTQNIVSESYVTTLQPDKRPQEINSVIAGRVEKWFVREGSFVKKGDTIIYLSEVKDAYFDPQLILRTQEQVEAQKKSIEAYTDNLIQINAQLNALIEMQNLRVKQAKNRLNQTKLKLQSDSARLLATETNLAIAKIQYERFIELQNSGLRSKNDLESRKAVYQEEQASYIEHQNNLLQSTNDQLNAEIQIINISNEFREIIANTNGKLQNAKSKLLTATGKLAQLNNTLSNYQQRGTYHFVLAPQDGNITKINKAGLGEVFKAGESIVTIMPVDFDLAIEMYVRPIDIPLIKKGGKIRISFDGWPAFIVSGWPHISFGTYGGEIVAIDRFISTNGLYRIMVAPDPEDTTWPDKVKVGTGAETIALLNKVPTWYEFWRQLNGFPPNYYAGNKDIKVTQDNLLEENKND